jgi:integrase
VGSTASTAAAWLHGLLQVRSASAWRGYRDCLDAYILPIIGATQLRELDTIRLNLLYVHLLEQGRRRVDRNAMMFAFYQADAGRKALIRYERGQLPRSLGSGLAPKTVRNVHVMLRSALTTLSDGTCFHETRQPMLGRHGSVAGPTPSGPRTWLLVCTTGFRRSELAGLRRGDLDLAHARVSSDPTRVVVGGYAVDEDGKSDRGRRTLAPDPVTVDGLREYVQRWDEWKREFGHNGEHLFCHPDGRPIHPDTITEWFTRLTWEAGLPPIRLHDVRHSYATAALRAGVPVKVVSERLGHSSVSFTQDTYMHVIPGMDEHGARVAAMAILGPLEAASDATVTTDVTIGADTPLA